MKINKKIYFKIKDFFDYIFSLIFLICGFPLFFLIAILVKFSSRGPIFFQHKRIGKNRKYFYCIKFRTMHAEADDILNNLLKKDETSRIEFERIHKLKNDPRITPIGKILRKSSLDEIPQFINVLKGEMSIVGPRPIVDKEAKKYKNSLNKVLSIKPGITGLWQVSGRNNLSYKKRVFLDSLYVKNSNILMDIRIIIRTLGVILFPNDRGAY